MNLKVFGYEVAFKAAMRKERTQPISGYTNRCGDGRLIVLLDYDIQYANWVIDELHFLQKKFQLGDFFCFETNKGYHAVCLDKLSLWEFVTVLEHSSVDPDYVRVPLRYGSKIWTLRFSPKDGKNIRYCGTIKSEWNNYREKSSPHAKILNDLFNLGIQDKGFMFDKQKKLILANYKVD
jgi:hypothetical protein